MDENLFSTNEPVTFDAGTGEDKEYMTDSELIESVESDIQQEAAEEGESSDVLTVSSGDSGDSSNVESSGDLLTNEVYMNGVTELMSVIDSESVTDEIVYVDRGVTYAAGGDLPDYAVVYLCNDVEVVFPTDYADHITVTDGVLNNFGSSYTAGLQIDGYAVDNYLSSEITIPTYHSSTWYQYLQAYGQPYRIVDRYVNTYGSISSSTRSSVNVEWSGGNPWAGFTFDKAALFIIVAILLIMFIFRKGNK